MKIKLALLVALACAGGAASVALADHGGDAHHGSKCSEVHLRGTLAAGSLALTVTKANHQAATPGSTVALALPAGARANVEACQTGTGTAATLTHPEIGIQLTAPKPTTTTAATTTSTTTPTH